ncbi:Uncharacterised protein [Acholeplasma oculi]|uniref:Bacterial Ig-like domain-containing protein n=1 Tax=Acholeplasma oculi TaxID=35623 RepID=A0A061ABL9_9MOLU|nr:Ig domain-containing protein [Acholeplasma oculi]CDR31265.1 hypothetical protein Aocu_11920 [Acholeplasma oculi]SKC38496.1 hypothetical protein SAMN02745122_0624 [Acholeplasma oculi]SUT91403.1 Uncharacterised protein [Acholeplasma oculi]
MKKITTLLLLLFAALVLVAPAYAAEEGEIVDIYPYDDPNALYGPSTPFTLVGDSNWDVTYLGRRYNIVRGGARFANLFTDANADGVFQPTEYGAVSWNAFAVMTINDGDSDVELTTASARTDITSVVHRLYSYFDEDGILQMFEDHIFTYYIHNDGADVTDNADWRFATEAEIDAFDAAETPATETPNTRLTQIRIIRDDSDTDGYVMEPLGYLTWRNPDLSALPENEQSLLLDYTPNHVVIPAGWTVVSFGTNDRGAYSSTDWIKQFPYAIAEGNEEAMLVEYDAPKPEFAGLTALDDDGASAGVQMIVEFQEEGFDLANTVSVSWIDMFDDTTGLIINQTKKLSYKVEIFQDDVLLETINFAYDSETDTYTPDKALSVVDSSVFGAGYKAVYSASHPDGKTTEINVDIAVGVLPPRFEGVADRFVEEGVYVDLLGAITANNGYGVDLTNTIEITVPQGFNYYSPKPGTYEIDLEFTYNVFIAGIPTELTIGTTTYDIDMTKVNTVTNVSVLNYGRFAVFTDATKFNTVGSGYGSVFLVAAADGTLKEWFDRYNWNHMTSTGVVVKDQAQFDAWRTGLTLAEGEFVVGMHGSTNTAGLRNLAFGHPISFVMGTEDFETDLVTQASYTLTVDDKTAPSLFVVDKNYAVDADKFTSVNAAILANVVAFDNFDNQAQLSIYVSANGGMTLTDGKLTPGTYNVVVSVDDRAGNSSDASFTVTVKPAKPTQEEVDQKVDEKVDEVEQQIPVDVITPDEVDAAIEAAIEEALKNQEPGVNVLTAVLMSLGAALLSFGGAALLFFLKKK